MKPRSVLGFVLLVFAFLGIVMLVVPEKGIRITENFSLHFPSYADLFLPDTTDYPDVEKIIEQEIDLDSLQAQAGGDLDTASLDSIIAANAEELKKSIHRLEFGSQGKGNLHQFFKQMPRASKGVVRILHYGDSQIEGDRITAFFRNKMQGRYGGSGPGLIPLVSAYDYRFSYVQENNGPWKRYPGYGRLDPNVPHKGYGALASFARFAPFWVDSMPNDSILYSADVKISKSKLSYSLVKTYSQAKLFYGKNKRSVSVVLKVDGVEIARDSLPPSEGLAVKTWQVAPQQSISLYFTGYDSPDFYGLSLQSGTGIIVDNIALRGSSGTIFSRMDRDVLSPMLANSKADLFILQFGGNVMPMIKDKQECINYGNYFLSQLRRLKSINPNAAIIVIGPSDMSMKEQEKYVTYPLLPKVRDALKDATFRAGGAYWDMFEAMGGMNSMPGWVEADPPLAATDYTHFSTRGARVIANMFYNAFLLEYNEYLTSMKNSKESKNESKKDTLKK